MSSDFVETSYKTLDGRVDIVNLEVTNVNNKLCILRESLNGLHKENKILIILIVALIILIFIAMYIFNSIFMGVKKSEDMLYGRSKRFSRKKTPRYDYSDSEYEDDYY